MSLQSQPQPSSRYRQAQSRRCAMGDCRQEGLFPAPRDGGGDEGDGEAKDARAWLCLEHARAANSAWNYYEDKSNEDIERDLRDSAVGYRPTWPMTPLRGRNDDIGGERSYAQRGEGANKSAWRDSEKSFANIFVEIFAENYSEDAPSFEQGKAPRKNQANPQEKIQANPQEKIQEKPFDARQNNYDNDTRIPRNREERKACRVLDLTPPIHADELKSRYRALAKAHHPDHHIANGKIGGKDKNLTESLAKNPDEQARQQKQERLKQINVAYSLLQSLWSKQDTP